MGHPPSGHPLGAFGGIAMKLSRWKRIGVIASIVWTLGAGGYTYYSQTNEIARLASSETQTCLTLLTDQPGRAADCQERGDGYRKTLPQVKYFALGVATVPVFAGWIVAFLGVRVGSWARRKWATLHGCAPSQIPSRISPRWSPRLGGISRAIQNGRRRD